MVKDFKNDKVLKLVHPGGFVEIHDSPMTADEVMKKNPRHCVARPNMFRFPWIVVRPESLLKPGGVFYIVPVHNIHSLPQKNRYQNQDPLLLQLVSLDSFLELTNCHQLRKQHNHTISPTRTKIDCKIEHWPEDTIFPKCLVRDTQHHDPYYSEESLVKSRLEPQLFYDSSKISFSVDSWDATFGFKVHQEPKQQPQVESFIEPRPLFSVDIASSDATQMVAFPKVESGELNSSEELKALKSCLKKDTHFKSRGLKVKFAFSDKDNEKIKEEVIIFQPIESP
ncbi:hypothetical protein MANES_08G105400v8 [Manihot esculenta]|uniref:Uncharacterized protein n=1 Tax=Manihot esculenta TaxID=3983 RepID=A0A2C9VH44_MANES|nr:hypothetical protein MANES_08G105400v8 [Manihot esculenta]